MHHTIRNPRAETNPLRSLPLYRSARSVFSSSARDVLVGAVNKAVQFKAGWAVEYAKARAGLGKANRTLPLYRRFAQGDAMRKLNAVRKAMKANLRAIAAAELALAAFDANPPAPPAWMVAAASASVQAGA